MAVVSVQNELMAINAHTHDARLGGEGFDNMLVCEREGGGGRGVRWVIH